MTVQEMIREDGRHVTLVIKGDMVDAMEAATKRGVPIEIRSADPRKGTLAIAPYRAYRQIQNWFIEDARVEAPFPLGSLLHYVSSELPDPPSPKASRDP